MFNPMQLSQMIPQIKQMLPQIKANPNYFLAQRGFPIQNGLTDPQQIAQQWLNSGRIAQSQFELARQIAAQIPL